MAVYQGAEREGRATKCGLRDLRNKWHPGGGLRGTGGEEGPHLRSERRQWQWRLHSPGDTGSGHRSTGAAPWGTRAGDAAAVQRAAANARHDVSRGTSGAGHGFPPDGPAGLPPGDDGTASTRVQPNARRPAHATAYVRWASRPQRPAVWWSDAGRVSTGPPTRSPGSSTSGPASWRPSSRWCAARTPSPWAGAAVIPGRRCCGTTT